MRGEINGKGPAGTHVDMIRSIQDFDTRTFLSFLNCRWQILLVKIALVVSFTADGWMYFVLLPLIIVLQPDDVRHYFAMALLALGMERALYYVLKRSIRRRRPPAAISGFKAVIVASDEFSLPSGHTSAAFLFVTFLCAGFSWLFLPLYLWAIAVGFSRVILGVHFFTDILIGALIGITIALIVLLNFTDVPPVY